MHLDTSTQWHIMTSTATSCINNSASAPCRLPWQQLLSRQSVTLNLSALSFAMVGSGLHKSLT